MERSDLLVGGEDRPVVRPVAGDDPPYSLGPVGRPANVTGRLSHRRPGKPVGALPPVASQFRRGIGGGRRFLVLMLGGGCVGFGDGGAGLPFRRMGEAAGAEVLVVGGRWRGSW